MTHTHILYTHFNGSVSLFHNTDITEIKKSKFGGLPNKAFLMKSSTVGVRKIHLPGKLILSAAREFRFLSAHSIAAE
jgi:hypothetical protein